jgi:GNAT superfamily N-acetyltransferase
LLKNNDRKIICAIATSSIMIRPTLDSETEDLLAIATGTAVFKPLEIAALKEVLDDYHAGNRHTGHRAITFEQEGKPIGFAYYAPTAMTDRTWHLYWIFVSKAIQAKGIGAKLLAFVEADIITAGGRLFLIETSSLPSYQPTRNFYLKYNYDQAATIRDFYSDGDDLVIFRKHLIKPS